MKRISAFFLAVISLFLFSCSQKFEFDEKNKSTFINNKTGVKFFVCPENLRPKTLGDSLGKTESGVEFFMVSGADPGEFISTGDGTGRKVFAAEGVKCPVFSDFQDAEIFVCSLMNNGYISADTVIENTTKIISKINELYKGENIPLPLDGKITNIHPIRFETKSVLPFYYFLWLYETKDGEKILYDEGLRFGMNAGDLFGDYV